MLWRLFIQSTKSWPIGNSPINDTSNPVLLTGSISFLKETPYPTIGRFRHVEGIVGRELKPDQPCLWTWMYPAFSASCTSFALPGRPASLIEAINSATVISLWIYDQILYFVVPGRIGILSPIISIRSSRLYSLGRLMPVCEDSTGTSESFSFRQVLLEHLHTNTLH